MNATPKSVSIRQEHKEYENIKLDLQRYSLITFDGELDQTPFGLYKYLRRVDIDGFFICYKGNSYTHENCRINNKKLIEQMDRYLDKNKTSTIVGETEDILGKSGQMMIKITLGDMRSTEGLKVNKSVSLSTESINGKINKTLSRGR